MASQRGSVSRDIGEGAADSPKDQGFGKLFTSGDAGNGGGGVPASGSPAQAGGGSVGPFRGGVYSGPAGRGAQSFVSSGSPNLGLQRRQGRKRVIGGANSVRRPGEDLVKSYTVAGGLQFNDVEEMRSDAISRAFAQELLEQLWEKWGLNTSAPEVMRKAEDVVFALFAMRTASPDADYDLYVQIGDREVNLLDLSEILQNEEVTRRRFARAVADGIRAYIAEPDNVRLREMLTVELGVKPEYAHLAFDGSTHCSGLSPNQIMFTKQLEHRNLFDAPETRDKLGSGQMLATGGFQVNRSKGAYSA